ncbi:hypothetical protein GCM10017567_73350 [Amycolatopsis bullii]|uniref:AMP-dependent synthetase/ligase domain-containing protein n=1 Tax=Amycolatopsis bullii TaxID=941987 RepID=A0ABQ3KPG7_9PSEU|nr:hypothetical protein GCM10017567_73350 [Amycolatopsis bullii]
MRAMAGQAVQSADLREVLQLGRRWTYRDLAAEVNAVALGLLSLGIDKGDRVGIWSPNRWEWTCVHQTRLRP